MSSKRMRWTDLLDVLTDSDRTKKVVVNRATETERLALFLLRREGWSAKISANEEKNYDLEVYKPGEKAVAKVRNQRAKVHLGQVEKFLDFLSLPNSKNFTEGIFISTSGFTSSVYTHIDPRDVAIRFSKQLMYWGFHLFDQTKPSLAFRTVGRYSYPRMDFLKLVDYLEQHTEIQPEIKSLAAKM